MSLINPVVAGPSSLQDEKIILVSVNGTEAVKDTLHYITAPDVIEGHVGSVDQMGKVYESRLLNTNNILNGEKFSVIVRASKVGNPAHIAGIHEIRNLAGDFLSTTNGVYQFASEQRVDYIRGEDGVIRAHYAARNSSAPSSPDIFEGKKRVAVSDFSSIQEAYNNLDSGSVLVFEKDKTYYETFLSDGKDFDIEGNGACISGAMSEFMAPGMWSSEGTFTGSLSGNQYQKWIAQYPSAYPFTPASAQYITISSEQGDRYYHYEAIADLEDHKMPVNNGEGFFVSDSGEICMISDTDPNTLSLHVSQATIPFEVSGGSIVNAKDMNVKNGPRYGIRVSNNSTLNLYNVNTENSSHNIVYNTGATGKIVGGINRSRYNKQWPWDCIKANIRMETNGLTINNVHVDVNDYTLIGGFNGIVAIGASSGVIDRSMVAYMQDDGYEFEEETKMVLKNSIGLDNFVALSTTPILTGGDAYVFNNLFVSTVDDWPFEYDWATGTLRTEQNSIYKNFSSTVGINQSSHFYNNTAYGYRANNTISLNDGGFAPLQGQDWKNNIFYSYGPNILDATGQAANGVEFDANVFWSEELASGVFTGYGYRYIGQDRPVSSGAGNPQSSQNLSGQTLPASWTDNIEANPMFVNAGENTLNRQVLLAAYAVAPNSPACSVKLSPVPAAWPCSNEANASTCAGIVRVDFAEITNNLRIAI